MKQSCAIARWLARAVGPTVCCVLVALVGCHLPAPQPSPTDPCSPRCSRSLLLARQVTADSAVEVTHHPLRCGRNLVVETGEHLLAIGTGAFHKRCCLACCGCPGPLSTANPDDHLSAPTGPPDSTYRPSHFELYPDPSLALMALRHALDQATERIDVLMFLWENDEVGVTVARWVTEKAAAGIHVRVVVDGGGNLIFSPFKEGVDVNGAVCEMARQPNVEVIRTRNPFCRFDHRKLVLVDSRLAWTGGRNFTHQSFFAQRDLSFTVVGPLVDDFQGLFDETWNEEGGCSTVNYTAPAASGPVLVAHSQVTVPSDPLSKLDMGGPPASPVQDRSLTTEVSPPPALPNAWAKLIQTGPAGHNLAVPLYEAVDGARHCVYMENGYLSDPRLVCKLAAARRRGVDVRVVMTICSKEEVVDCANRVTANRLLRAGVRVFLCPRMTHVKAGLVDGAWAYLGTGNYDALSLRHNSEFGLLVGGPVVGELEQRLFQEDFCPEWELKAPLPVSWLDCLGEVVMCLYL